MNEKTPPAPPGSAALREALVEHLTRTRPASPEIHGPVGSDTVALALVYIGDAIYTLAQQFREARPSDVEQWRRTFERDFEVFCDKHGISNRIRWAIIRNARIQQGANETNITRAYGGQPTLEEFMYNLDRARTLRKVGTSTINTLRAAWRKENE